MRLSSNEIKGWLGLVIAIQVLCIVAFVFCHDIYILPYTWIRQFPVEEWEWLVETPNKYSADVEFLLAVILDSQEIFGRGFRLEDKGTVLLSSHKRQSKTKEPSPYYAIWLERTIWLKNDYSAYRRQDSFYQDKDYTVCVYEDSIREFMGGNR